MDDSYASSFHFQLAAVYSQQVDVGYQNVEVTDLRYSSLFSKIFTAYQRKAIISVVSVYLSGGGILDHHGITPCKAKTMLQSKSHPLSKSQVGTSPSQLTPSSKDPQTVGHRLKGFLVSHYSTGYCSMVSVHCTT